MFTGLVECKGRLARRVERGPSQRLALASPLDGLVVGESIAVNGACLTVVGFSAGDFDVDVSLETLEKTTLGRLSVGSEVNLERSLRAGDRLGGHLVSGHVDGIARVVEITRSGEARRATFEMPQALARYVAKKGSVALDGVSLTVNDVAGQRFAVMLIPHTLAVTTLDSLSVGSPVNLEIDLVARYVVRYLEASQAGESPARDPEAGLRAAIEGMNPR